MQEVVIRGAARLKPVRKPEALGAVSTLLADVLVDVVKSAGLELSQVDGLAVSSFSLSPDHAIDLAWDLGIRASWLMEDPTPMNLLQHAVDAVRSGSASTIVILAGDRMVGSEFQTYAERYNRVTGAYLRGIGPNARFAYLTRRHMAKYGLSREDYGGFVVRQRRWAGSNPQAMYRAPMTLEEYLRAPMVAEPLSLLDCPPLVVGAEALVVSATDGPGDSGRDVRVRAIQAQFNFDNQVGDGLETGLTQIVDRLWQESAVEPLDVDIACVYDNYPAVALIQLSELGIIRGDEVGEYLDKGQPGAVVNPSGGLLSAGQAGAAGGLHGLVEASLQLRGERGAGQVVDARTAVVAGYGMLLYGHGGCSVATVLESGGIA